MANYKIPNIQVMGARLVLQPDEVQTTTASGIVLPGAALEQNNVGTVVVTGPGQRLDNGTLFPMEVKVGDRVIYQRTSGVPMEQDGQQYVVINEAHILAVVPGGEA